MGDVINLNQRRKLKERRDALRQASNNRVVYGRTKEEKTLARLERNRERLSLELKLLQDKSKPGEPNKTR